MLRAPDELSTAIRVAVWDMLKVEEQRDTYYFDGGVWHDGIHDNGIEKCAVCFAGGIMAMELGADPNDDCSDISFGAKWSAVFHALNRVRSGDLHGAADAMHSVDYVERVSYRFEELLPMQGWFSGDGEEREEFRAWALKVADLMQELGL